MQLSEIQAFISKILKYVKNNTCKKIFYRKMTLIFYFENDKYLMSKMISKSEYSFFY